MIDRAKLGPQAARVLFLIFAAVLATGALAAACGGSASESPWPVEPERVVSDPEGEDGRGVPRKEPRPDAGSRVDPDAGPNVEP